MRLILVRPWIFLGARPPAPVSRTHHIAMLDDQWEEELCAMEREEEDTLDMLLDYVLMEEPFEQAALFRRRLFRANTRGQLRDMIEAKLREHGVEPHNYVDPW